MTKEEKEILLKDLLARLPYNVKVAIDFQSYIAWLPADEKLDYPYRKNLSLVLDCRKKTIEDISTEPNILYAYPCKGRFMMLCGYSYQEDYGVPIEFIKPYLRPLSSMTEEEKEEFIRYAGYEVEESVNGRHYEYCLKDYVGTPENPTCNCDATDWLNAHHFDYRGLIPMGLAKEAPEGMYDVSSRQTPPSAG